MMEYREYRKDEKWQKDGGMIEGPNDGETVRWRRDR